MAQADEIQGVLRLAREHRILGFKLKSLETRLVEVCGDIAGIWELLPVEPSPVTSKAYEILFRGLERGKLFLERKPFDLWIVRTRMQVLPMAVALLWWGHHATERSLRDLTLGSLVRAAHVRAQASNRPQIQYETVRRRGHDVKALLTPEERRVCASGDDFLDGEGGT